MASAHVGRGAPQSSREEDEQLAAALAASAATCPARSTEEEVAMIEMALAIQGPPSSHSAAARTTEEEVAMLASALAMSNPLGQESRAARSTEEEQRMLDLAIAMSAADSVADSGLPGPSAAPRPYSPAAPTHARVPSAPPMPSAPPVPSAPSLPASPVAAQPRSPVPVPAPSPRSGGGGRSGGASSSRPTPHLGGAGPSNSTPPVPAPADDTADDWALALELQRQEDAKVRTSNLSVHQRSACVHILRTQHDAGRPIILPGPSQHIARSRPTHCLAPANTLRGPGQHIAWPGPTHDARQHRDATTRYLHPSAGALLKVPLSLHALAYTVMIYQDCRLEQEHEYHCNGGSQTEPSTAD